jgi:betaine-aldehyde dehydrogenase
VQTEEHANFEGMMIDGSKVQSTSGKTFATYNPATGEALASLPFSEEEDVRRAVDAARRALQGGEWPRLTARERGKLLLRMADLVRERQEELARQETMDNGKPIRDTLNEIAYAADVFEYYAGAANKFFGTTVPVAADGLDYTLREPVGVVAAIIPWNGPFVIAAYKIAPALATGNTVVLKPSELAPLTALQMGGIGLEAGLPPGVLNVITGPGTTGEALVESPDVDFVGFTGSVATGQRIMQQGAKTLKKLLLELGGKSPNIVFDDANLDAMVASSVLAVFTNAGQDCCARSRAIVHKSIYDEFLEKFVANTTKLRIGDPLDPESEIGPLISRNQLERARSFVSEAKSQGASVRCGDDSPSVPGLSNGHFMNPVVLDNLSRGSRAVKEEIFGPVLSVLPFETEEEAIEMGNEASYGLAGSLWTRDIGRALRIAKRIRAGQFSINSDWSVHLEAPFGGYKMSGIGRQLGMEALEQYTQIKNVFVSYE